MCLLVSKYKAQQGMVFSYESLTHQVIYSIEIKSLVAQDVRTEDFVAVFSVLVFFKKEKK